MPRHRIAFNDVELHPYVQQFTEEYGPAWYGHRYYGTPGQLAEKLTPGMPRKISIPLEFANGTTKEEVISPIVKTPIGVLIHPDVGRMRAVLQYPVRATYSFVDKGELSRVELRFEENTLNQELAGAKGAASRVADVRKTSAETSAAAEAMRAAIRLRYTVGATAQRYRALAEAAVTQVTSFVQKAVAYADAADAAIESGDWNPALDLMVKQLPPELERATVAVRAASSSDSYSTLEAAERALYAAAGLEQALKESGAAAILVEIQGQMLLSVFVARQYPGRSFDQRWALVEKIRRINRLSRSDCLQPGQKILIPAG